MARANKILVVDDDLEIRMLYADELSEEGYEVAACGDGLGLMNAIRKESPNLIVMDIRLGRKNGLDLLHRIKNKYTNLLVILSTAYPAFRYDMKSTAADYFITKNSNLHELNSAIKRAINGESSVRPAPIQSRLSL